MTAGIIALIYRLMTYKDTSTKAVVAAATPSSPPNFHPDRSDLKGVEHWLSNHIEYCEELIEVESDKHTSVTPEVNETLFWFGIILPVVMLLGGLTIAIWLLVPSVINLGVVPFNPQYFFFLPILAYIIAGFRMVGTDEVAGADFFGLPVIQFKRGPKWIPRLILNLNKEKSTFVQSEFPGDADHIQWSDEKTPLDPGKVRPIFVLTGENPDGKLPTDVQMTIGISVLAKFQLVHERFFDLIANVSPVDDQQKADIRKTLTGGENVSDLMLEVVRHLRDTSTAIMGEIAGQLSYNEITSHLHLVNKLLHLRLEKTILTWGVRIVECRVTKTNPGHDFNEKIQKRAAAKAERDNLATVAEGERTKRILEGEGDAAAEQALLEARAKGYAKIAEVAKTDEGRVAISADVAGKLAESDSNTIVVGTDGIKELVGLVTTIKKGT